MKKLCVYENIIVNIMTVVCICWLKLEKKKSFIFDEFHCFYLTQMNKFKIQFPSYYFNQHNIKLSLPADMNCDYMFRLISVISNLILKSA